MHTVVPRGAVQTAEVVCAPVSEGGVRSGPAEDEVVSAPAEQGIAAGETAYQVVSAVAPYPVVPEVADEGVRGPRPGTVTSRVRTGS